MWHGSFSAVPKLSLEYSVALLHYCVSMYDLVEACFEGEDQIVDLSLSERTNSALIFSKFYHRRHIRSLLMQNKVAFEPGVLPRFAITYFFNHCNILCAK